MDVRAAASELYGVAPADFVATRTRLARQARAAGDRDLAAAIAALPKPTLSASAVNLLVRARPDDVERLLTVGARLRSAQAAASGEEVRDLNREAHHLLAAARSEAEALAREAGQALSGPMAQRVQATLHAGMADPQAAQAVRSGLLVTDLASTGLGPVDVTGALAVAVAVAVAVAGTESAEPPSDALLTPPPPQPARPRAGPAESRPAESRPAESRPVARTVRHQGELRKPEGQEAAQEAQRQAARLAAAADDAVRAARTRLDDAEAALADLEREAADRDAEVTSLTARLRELRAAQASAVVRERRARSERDQAARALGATRKAADRARAAVPDRAD